MPVPNTSLTLRAALADGGDGAVTDLVAARGGTPLLDGTTATFVYQGEAEEVAFKHWMDTFPHIDPMERIGGTDTWIGGFELPATARVEYKLAVRRHGRRRLVFDPLNPEKARDPFGANSLATGVAYMRPAWSVRHADVPSGSSTPIAVASDVFDEPRIVQLYRPANRPGRLPLLLVHDGSDYRHFAALLTVLDNLIHSGDMAPTLAALIDPGIRTGEYAADDRHADHLVGEVLPAIRSVADVDVDRVVAIGASLGGVASLHAAWRYPGTFSGLVLQSGSFVTALGGPFRRGPVFAPVVRFMEAFTAAPGPLPPRMHLSCGRYDGLYHDDRMMAEMLSAHGVQVGWEEAPDGHHWEQWRDRTRSGLVHVLPVSG